MGQKIKKITFLSAIVISVGSTIGAGIFFKNSSVFSNAGGSLGLAVASWLVSAIGVLAIGVSLIELASARYKDFGDGGIISWVKKFTTKKIGKYSAAYMVLFYIPFTYVALPLYMIQTIQDATNNTWLSGGWEVAGAAFGVFLWMSIIGFFSFRVAERLQWVFTFLKFIPIVVIPLIAITQGAQNDLFVTQIDRTTTGLTAFSPWLGIVASIPAILFAFDGFYTVVSIQSGLPRPNKIGAVTSISISIVTSAYLFYAILTGLIGATSPGGVPLISDNPWVGSLINAIISISVLGIVNGYAISSPRVYRAISDEDKELSFGALIARIFRIKNLAFTSWLASVFFATFFFFVLTPIAIYAWKDTTYISDGVPIYGAGAGSLYEMADLLTNFTSIIVFVFIGIAILGGIINRRRRETIYTFTSYCTIDSSNVIETRRMRYFSFFAWVAVIFIFTGASYFFIAEFVNIFEINGSNQQTSIVKFAILASTLLISALPQTIRKFVIKRTVKKVKTATN